MKKITTGLSLSLLALLAIVLLPLAQRLDQTDTVSIATPVNSTAHSITQATHESIKQPPQLKYLTGTDIDGHLAQDSQGNLIIDRGLLDFIDYHLSTFGRLNEKEIILQLQKQFTLQLEEPARQQALSFLRLYQQYGKEYAELTESGTTWFQQGMTIDVIDESLKSRQQLRQNVFGMDTASTLWQQEEDYDQQVVNNIRLRRNNQDHLINTDTLPSKYKQANHPSQLSNQLHQQEIELRNTHAHSSEIYQLRILTLGLDAAERLSGLDKENLHWKTRLEDYLQEKESIQNDVGYSKKQKKLKVVDLKNELFSSSEQRRLLAYELHPKLLHQL